MRELHDNLNFRPGLYPVAATTDNTAYVSQILDMQGLAGAEFVILTGSLADADATFAVTAAEGNQSNMSDAAAVDPSNLLGTLTLASFNFSNDNSVFKLGFLPSGDRYKQVTITPSGNTGNAFIAGVWVTKPSLTPAPNPPA